MPDDFDPVAWFENQKKSRPQQPEPSGGDFDPVKWHEDQQKQSQPAPNVVLPTERQEFGRRSPSFDESLQQSARYNRARAVAPITPDSTTGPLYESLQDQNRRGREKRQAEFAAKPLSERVYERTYDALARSGGQLVKQARNVAGFLGPKASNPYALPIDIPPSRFEQERNAELAERQANRPPGGFLTQTGEAILEAAGPAAAGYLLTEAGLPAALVGGSMAAAGADFSDPTRAITQTAIGALAPVAGGRIGQAVGGRVASRLASPVAQRLAGAGAEVLGGGAGNVIGTGAEELAFEGRLNPRELIKSGLVGGALTAPGAVRSLRPSTGLRSLRPQARADRAALEVPATQPLPRIAAEPVAVPTTRRLAPALAANELPQPSIIEEAETAGLPTRIAAPQPAAAPARKIHHSQFGEVAESPDQSGIRKGRLRVVDGEGDPHIIKNPRIAGNREASFTKSEEERAAGVLPELSVIENASAAPALSVSSARSGASGPRPDEAAFNTGALPLTTRTPILETLSALRKAGLLTGIKTHLRNIGGNLAFAGAEEVSRIPASVADLAISAVSGRRTITGPSARGVANSAYSAATQGIREAGQILRRGLTNQQAQALQLNQEINSGNKVVDAYVNGVFRTLGAEDAVFRKYAFIRAVQDRALAQAKTEARQGQIIRSDISNRANQIAANPDPSMTADAILDSEVATFNNSNLVSDFLSAGRQKIAGKPGARAAGFGLDLVLPFTKTPTNIIARMLEYSPAGFGKNAVQVARAIASRTFTLEQQRQFSTTFGRGAAGSALILLGYKLGAAGLMTGFAETDPSKRNRDVAAGRTPGAILNPLTNTHHQVSAFSPIGSLLAIGATLQREENQPLKNESSRAGNVAAAATQTVAQQPLLIGAKEVSEAITRPGTVGERAGRIAGSFVPTIVSDVGELTDSQRREGRGFVGNIARRIPGARNYLPPATDVLGRPLEDRKTAFFDPTLTSAAKDKTQPFERELTRLDMGLTAPKKDEQESEAAFRDRRAKAGQLFERASARLIDSPRYRRATPAQQKAAFVYLQRAVHDQSDEAEPNPEKLHPSVVMESVIEAEARKREKERLAKSK
jgi:hypothetical protein